MASRFIHHNSYNTSTASLKTIDKEEIEANTAISDLINDINILVTRRDPLIRCMKSPKLLIRGLTELKSMIEMVDVKHSIVRQIKFLITNHARKQNRENDSNVRHGSQFEGHMLHSVISGNPGTGKTTVGMILAKIWMALGFVNKKDSTSSSSSSSPISSNNGRPDIIVTIVNEKYNSRVKELEEDQRNSQRKLDRLRELLFKYQTVCADVRRKAIKLRPTTSQPSEYDGCHNIEKEWDDFIATTRELRFGLDEIIREANVKDNVTTSTGSSSLSKSSPATLISNDTSTSEPPELIDNDPYEHIDPKFVIASREDLIAEYLGQTAPKTKKVLESARGGVLFIDEAYSLCTNDNGSKDKYGEECLTTINEFMSLHSDEIIIIFAGYKDKLMSSIFKVQPGLFRRCLYFFEIKDYTPRGLSKIFKLQLERNSWMISPDVDLEKIITDNKNVIQDGGGGTGKLAFFSKIEYGISKFFETVNCPPDSQVSHDSIITSQMILSAINEMKKNIDDRMVLDEPPLSMYT